MNRPPLKYASDLARALYQHFSSLIGTGAEIVEKRDMVDRITPVTWHAAAESKTPSVPGFVGLGEDGFLFTAWLKMPGPENSRTTEWHTPNPILSVGSLGKDRRDDECFHPEKGSLYRDESFLKFGYFNDSLILGNPVTSNIVVQVLSVSGQLTAGAQNEDYWTWLRYPELKPERKPKRLIGV